MACNVGLKIMTCSILMACDDCNVLTRYVAPIRILCFHQVDADAKTNVTWSFTKNLALIYIVICSCHTRHGTTLRHQPSAAD